MHAILEVELDVDRRAQVRVVPGVPPKVVVFEDMHYPLEEERRRQATPRELAEVEEKIGRGQFAVLSTSAE